MVKFAFKAGYTLVELTIVIAIIGVIAGIAFYGLSLNDPNRLLKDAKLNMISSIRSLQTQATAGSPNGKTDTLDNKYAHTLTINSTYYKIDSTQIDLKNNLVISKICYQDQNSCSTVNGETIFTFKNHPNPDSIDFPQTNTNIAFIYIGLTNDNRETIVTIEGGQQADGSYYPSRIY